MKTEDKYPNFFAPLDAEEAEIMEAIENDEFIVDKYSEKNMQVLKQIAENTLKKKAITIRLQQQDVSLIKKLAGLDGIPYQTLIGSIIHRYAH